MGKVRESYKRIFQQEKNSKNSSKRYSVRYQLLVIYDCHDGLEDQLAQVRLLNAGIR